MDESAQRTAEVPVPTAGQVLVRALPAAVRTAAAVEACARIGASVSAVGRTA